MTDDIGTDQRHEDILRTALRLSFGYESDQFDGPLLSAARDPNARVRDVAVSAVRWLSLHDTASPALDATLWAPFMILTPECRHRQCRPFGAATSRVRCFAKLLMPECWSFGRRLMWRYV